MCDRAKRSQLQHSFLCMSGAFPGAGAVGARGTQDPAVTNPAAMNNRRCSFLPCRLAFLPKILKWPARVRVFSQLTAPLRSGRNEAQLLIKVPKPCGPLTQIIRDEDLSLPYLCYQAQMCHTYLTTNTGWLKSHT